MEKHMESVYDRDFGIYEERIKQRALEAFADDINGGDITTKAVFGIREKHTAGAVIVAEEDCTLAGILEARAILEDGGLKVSGKRDGEDVKRGDVVLTVEGPLHEILARERVVLNYIIQMSGIATISRRLFRRHGRRVLFLRKTNPGLLLSEKRAVRLGGCLPHRINLSDGILIKDNHIEELAKESGREMAIKTAIMRADRYRRETLWRRNKKLLPIEIEADSLEDAVVAAKELSKLRGPNIIMLDNMTPEYVRKAVRKIREIGGNIIIEASGGITEETIDDYLRAGADCVSTSLFISAKSCRFRLDIIR